MPSSYAESVVEADDDCLDFGIEADPEEDESAADAEDCTYNFDEDPMDAWDEEDDAFVPPRYHRPRCERRKRVYAKFSGDAARAMAEHEAELKADAAAGDNKKTNIFGEKAPRRKKGQHVRPGRPQ